MMPADNGYPPHVHECRVCQITSFWCCRHRYTISYIAVVVTLLLITSIWEIL